MQNGKNVQEEFTDKNMEEQFMKIQILSAMMTSQTLIMLYAKVNFIVVNVTMNLHH